MIIQINASCPKSFVINNTYYHSNSTNEITEQEYNSIEDYWKQYVTILSRNLAPLVDVTVRSSDINTNVNICNVPDNSDGIYRDGEQDNGKDSKTNLVEANLEQEVQNQEFRAQLVNVISNSSNKKTKGIR